MPSKIVIVDENDNKISYKEREKLKNEDIYRVSALWIINSKGEILLARRALTKSHSPGKWGPAVAGTVEQGETYYSNITKEAKEKLGLEDIKPETGPKIRVAKNYNYFCQWFLLNIDKPTDEFKIQKSEVEELKWVSKEELLSGIKDNPDNFVEAMKEWVKLLEKNKHYIPNSREWWNNENYKVIMEDFERKNMAAEKQTPLDRLNYKGDLGVVVNRLAKAYEIGDPIDFSVIVVGYEDCNVIVQTPDGKYVAKIFSKDRNNETIARYSEIMEKAVEGGVNHPPLVKTGDGETVYSDDRANGISMVLMKFVEGRTFLELGRAPDVKEQKAAIEQAAKVNRIDCHPSYLFDSWAIPNIKPMFKKVKRFIQPQDLKLVEYAMAKYEEIPVDALPHCFVHGDFTKANVLKGKDGKIYILDFSVANWYPRIQELAIITANLLHDEDSGLSLRDRAERVSDMYDKLNPLTEEEKKHLYAYALAGVAMEFMGGHQEKFIKGNATKETEYWLNLGRTGLRRELS